MQLKYIYITIFFLICLDLWLMLHIFAASFPYVKEVSLNNRRMGNDGKKTFKYPFIIRKRINYY